MLVYTMKEFFLIERCCMDFRLYFLTVMCCFGVQYTFLSAEQDAQGRTPLMNYVIAQERAIKKQRQDIEKLWHICYKETRYAQQPDTHAQALEALKKGLVSPQSSLYTMPKIPQVSQMSTMSHSSRTIGKSVKTYTTKTVRKESCTDEDMQAYEQSQRDLDDLIMTTMQQITFMVQDEANLGIVDNFGKSVLNYCYTFKIYKKLRELGVPFQFDTWLYWLS